MRNELRYQGAKQLDSDFFESLRDVLIILLKEYINIDKDTVYAWDMPADYVGMPALSSAVIDEMKKKAEYRPNMPSTRGGWNQQEQVCCQLHRRLSILKSSIIVSDLLSAFHLAWNGICKNTANKYKETQALSRICKNKNILCRMLIDNKIKLAIQQSWVCKTVIYILDTLLWVQSSIAICFHEHLGHSVSFVKRVVQEHFMFWNQFFDQQLLFTLHQNTKDPVIPSFLPITLCIKLENAVVVVAHRQKRLSFFLTPPISPIGIESTNVHFEPRFELWRAPFSGVICFFPVVPFQVQL